ncbi:MULTISPECIES: hypothetical protein [unclassified Neisseria]|uniref:hypothetical protein n=1 Tax=unclassified Neisseria TaxID=2623750 RepID=UPI00266604A1|nr:MULTISPECIES: hypothetical protein [unclassified Neisseria]MDO1510907.1 hypothetical protein [Neisseria sp. MVDL19-042950]MDO1517197.1 hypothetical protein [Neisseria sp. MVDL18-041461]MDO1564534.1 hypothetical protein [Neisseria sp. MVDL20-010259]
MMKHAFILSDCEPPESEEKPYALLTANPTKGHHFIAQTEQRQHAFNSHVNPQNQNVYRWPLSLFRERYRGRADSVNIENNLEVNNLYTLAFVEGSGGIQYNLENWFSRHEGGYEEACGYLRHLEQGRQKAPKALWRVLQLKLLGILRNPYNHNNLFVHRLHQAILAQLPHISTEFVTLIAQRPQPRLRRILKKFAFTPDGYTRWLANLYGMLSEGVLQPSLFERLFAALFSQPEAVKIELYRYPDQSGYCFFADSSYCLQYSEKTLSVGVSVAADMFAIVHLQSSHWRNIEENFAEQLLPRADIPVTVVDNNHTQRIVYNRLCIRWAHEAVFGKSNRKDAYF